MKKIKILVVEDDRAILTGIKDLLESEGYEACTAADGKEAIFKYTQEKPTLILLDIMMPEKSGYDVCRDIRKKDPYTPIVMLTAKGQEVDKVIGLELGADDYIVKPFGINELLARIRVQLRRLEAKTRERDLEPIYFGDVRVDPKTFFCTKGNKKFFLSSKELSLLDFLVRHEGEVVDRFTLLDEIWGIKYQGTTRTLDQHIAKLRQKIEDDPSNPVFIQTVHGVGYRFSSDPGDL